MTDPLPPLRDVIAAHALGARKSLGQHFLLDLNLTAKIARIADTGHQDHVLEIGPGPGGLTRALLATGANVTVIERDARCMNALEEIKDVYPQTLEIVEGNALSVNEREIAAAHLPIKIISNLPYNISTELLIKWLRFNHQEKPVLWSILALMFQKEVADRILARPGSKTYGRLSIIAQAASQPSRALDLPARAFTPPPKVDSTVVRFDAHQEKFDHFTALEKVTQAAFSNRRKMLRSSLKPIFGAALGDILQRQAIDPTARGETLTVDEFKNLARAYSALNSKLTQP